MARILKKIDQKKNGITNNEAEHYQPSIVTGGGIINKKVLSADDEAKRIIEKANVKANEIVDEANRLKDGVDQIRENAKKKGFEAGKAEALESFNEKIIAIRELKEKFFENAEPEMIKLVMRIVEKVIGDLVDEKDGVVEAVVKQALERVIGDKIIIRINPKDSAELKAKGRNLKELVDKTRHMSIKEDDSIGQGGCIVETEVGTIDARLETQLKAIKKTLGV